MMTKIGIQHTVCDPCLSCGSHGGAPRHLDPNLATTAQFSLCTDCDTVFVCLRTHLGNDAARYWLASRARRLAKQLQNAADVLDPEKSQAET